MGGLFLITPATRADDALIRQAIFALEEKQFSFAYAVFSEWSLKGHAEATYYQGLMLLEGLGVEPDATKATSELRRSADMGYPPAQYRLGQMLRQGGLIPTDLTESAKLMRAAANRGHENAKCVLARMLFTGEGEPKNLRESFALSSAQPSNPDCQIITGLHHNEGTEAAPKDHARAFSLMKSAAEGGNLEAFFVVGYMLYSGIGVSRDQIAGMQWIDKAIEVGDRDAIGFSAHQRGARSAGFAISEESRQRRAEEKRERDRFWAEVSGAVAVALPVIASSLQQQAAERAIALQRQTELAALRTQQSAPNVTAPKKPQSQIPPPRTVVAQSSNAGQNLQAFAREQALLNVSVQKRMANQGSTSLNKSQAREAEPNIRWPEGLVICPRPAGGKDVLFGASVCYGPRGSAFIDRVAGDINMAEVSQACGTSARDIGWIENQRVFGCGFGVNPSKSSLVNHYDQANRRGIVVPNRRSYSCPASQSDVCRNQH